MSTTCHVVSHVHWDREWYRPFEGYRSRLLELVERVCDDLDAGRIASFHLDGQTVTLDDVAALRPDVADRVRRHAAAGRITIGPWHVLADNQLVSAENLVRNLLLARRTAGDLLSDIGYSPDAFGHPADLPRVLVGFGIDTALVWRGAPPEHARFRWRSPDGAEVFTVNQAYHQAEVLWPDDPADAATALEAFVRREADRVPAGPQLLLNGGDHLVPPRPAERAEAIEAVRLTTGVAARPSTLPEFFAAARTAAASAAADLPVVEGELRHLGDRLTFLLPGTLSARAYVKSLNDRAQTLLERFVEPAAALATVTGRGPANAREALAHAWDLLVKNAPHDSICGCSVDEVHRETTVRAERVLEVGDQLVRRAALAEDLDVRGDGKPAAGTVDVLVRSGSGDDGDGPVVVDVVTAAGRYVVGLRDPDGHEVPVEAEHLGAAQWFEADLDLLPDTLRGERHRLAFVARDVPAFGWAVYTAVLGDAPTCSPERAAGRAAVVDGTRLVVEDDASVTLTGPDGVTRTGLGRLVDGGDRGDSYTYDPPADDELVTPSVRAVEVVSSPVRTRLVVSAALDLPTSLDVSRDARSADRREHPVTLVVERWVGDPVLRWDVRLDNAADDHRLRFHVPVAGAPTTWQADTHWSVQDRPFGPVVGALPEAAGLEAAIGTAPAHTFAVAGQGTARVAVLLDALPEVQGLDAAATGGPHEIAVTLLRSVGWLSRFDLRTRTTGAGPAFEVPEAQCHGERRVRLGVVVGADATDDLALARTAAAHHVPLRADQLRAPAARRRSPRGAAPRVQGALVSAFKPAESGEGVVLRVANPSARPASAVVHLPGWARRVAETRLDERTLDGAPSTGAGADGLLPAQLGPYGVRTWLLRTDDR
ncbi:glycosyl hydrolase-related protein [Isoptericola sp. S6320L]|uniref:glycoside hydrolase family 38 N-terminal domain-containing protein n=1 Tax=Isoptericola sp. S6320L TaxID=2926411 RepID=UPI001FF5956C|nr:glycosyl hydrolase-related protein [Isoptericola sp. S6320L]MCK0115953.1 glycosyl hydrolase-related protein [Isoptericola sp. S6320L]